MDDSELIRGDLRWGSIPGLLRDAAAVHGGREALVDASPDDVHPQRSIRIGFDELARRADAVAAALVAVGVQPGDRVAIWAPNIWEWPVVQLGLHSAGAVLVPLSTRYRGTEAAHILRASGARLLFCVEGFLGNRYVSMLDDATDGLADLPHLDSIVVLRGDPPEGTVSFADFLAGGEAVDRAEVDARVEALGPDDLSDILFTSGTTGAPKGVMCTHGQVLRGYAAWAGVVGLRAEDRYLVINPFFHAFGYKAGIIAALTVGATLVPEAVFDVPAAMASIAAERISMIPGPPTLYQAILNHPSFDPAALSTLRLAVTGAAVVPHQLIADMRDVLGFETVITGYGLTESCGIAAMCRHDDDIDTIAGFSGRAIPGVELRTVDEAGATTPAMQAGELLVRGYNVMKGYFEDPDKTAETIDTDGWLHTGDVAVMDDRGYVRITDRTKDMFIVNGFNVYPAEVETLLLDHPGLAQVAVVGVPDERAGEVGVAFAVPAAGVALDPDELREWARGHMANFKVPARVEVCSELPLNASGKVLKFELRERALADRR